MWLVMALWPQPAHRVVGEPLYTSRSSPIRFAPVTVVRGAVATAPWPLPLPLPDTGWSVPLVDSAEAWLMARFSPPDGGISSMPTWAESTRGVFSGLSCGVLMNFLLRPAGRQRDRLVVRIHPCWPALA